MCLNGVSPANASHHLEPRVARGPTLREEFYESDCQGRFSSLLIAFSSLPVQSALSVPMGTIASASGWAEQSFSAGSYQYTPSILIQTIASDSVITTDGVNHGSI